MIKLHQVKTISDKQKLFETIDPQKSTWVVADMQSRTFLQNRLLETRPGIEESSVVIANELWKELLFLSDPEYRLISEDLARSLIWEWVRPFNLPWAKTPASARRILQQLDLLSPILAHENSEELLSEWFTQNELSVFRWRHMFEIGRRLWKEFEERKWALTVWIPSLLVQPDKKRPKWPRELYLDLGVRVSTVEMQLIREMANHQDIHVIQPDPEWAARFVPAFDPYRLVNEEPDKKKQEGAKPLFTFQSNPNYRRFSTHLAEVKDATAQLREWLDEGIAPTSMAIVAPDIEVYGSALKIYLEDEGIPVQRGLSEPLHSHPDIARWLSEIRLRLNRFSKRDLEVHLFQSQEDISISYDEFRRVFGKFYDPDDLARLPSLKKKLGNSSPNDSTHSTQAEFLDWALRLCSKDVDLGRIAALVSEFSSDGISDISLGKEVWLGMLEDLASSLSLSKSEQDPDGIYILSLGSAEWIPVTHVIFLNASENALRRWNDSPFTSSEANRLLKDLGFAVSSHEAQPAEFELCWLLDRPWEKTEFYFATANFAGEALTPSRFWLQGAFGTTKWKNTVSPREARLDEIQRAPLQDLAAIKGWTEARANLIDQSLKQDAGLVAASPMKFTGQRLSASLIESYRRCGFIFAAQRIFGLTDEPCLDLDLDRMSRGRLMHRIFAMLGTEPFRSDLNDEEILKVIDEARTLEEIQFAEEQMWPPLRTAHLKLAKNFLKMEKTWREKFPATKTLKTETSFKCSWDQKTFEWIPETEGALAFSGRIDRIDGDGEGHYALIDYKSSVNVLRNWNSWIENDQLQLAIYSDLLERGLTDLPKGIVEAAVYYVCNAESRTRGFYQKESSEQLVALEPRMRNGITNDEKGELFSDVRAAVGETLKKISEGNFLALPKKTTICEECKWNRLCRAPHLN
jgi:ATP-dependent helicase/nuclease subunit B